MKLLNKLRRISHNKRLAEQKNQIERAYVDEHENMFDKVYQTQTDQLRSSTGMVAGFYQFIGDKHD
jgi:hypothetical protein